MSKVIEKNVPIPEHTIYNKDGMANVMRKMKVGDSFECSESERNSAHTTARYVGIKIITRRQMDGTYRVWRIADKAAVGK